MPVQVDRKDLEAMLYILAPQFGLAYCPGCGKRVTPCMVEAGKCYYCGYILRKEKRMKLCNRCHHYPCTCGNSVTGANVVNEWHIRCETCRHGQDIPNSTICKVCKKASSYQPTYIVLKAELAEARKRIAELEAEVALLRGVISKYPRESPALELAAIELRRKEKDGE